MPELPEVQTTVDGLKKKVLKRTFIDAWSDWEKIIKKPDNFEIFRKNIKGKKIEKIWRRAKNIIFDLSDGPALSRAEGYSLLVHQKMTGHLLYGVWNKKDKTWLPSEKGPLNDPMNRFIHLIVFLDNKKMIALSDTRKFAKVELWKTEALLKEFEKLGPEPLDKNFTFQKFKDILKNKKGPSAVRRGKIKQVLMNPEIIAGIGNIYSSEALWHAKVHPQKETQKLNEKELKNIYNSIKKVLELGVKLGGESFSDYRKPDGSKGNFDTERKAYKREGQNCSRCKTKIQRIKFGGRSAFFCPHCQPFD